MRKAIFHDGERKDLFLCSVLREESRPLKKQLG
jgi:hypothetical protein